MMKVYICNMPYNFNGFNKQHKNKTLNIIEIIYNGL